MYVLYNRTVIDKLHLVFPSYTPKRLMLKTKRSPFHDPIEREFCFYELSQSVFPVSDTASATTRTRVQYATSSYEKPGSSTKDVRCDVFGCRRLTYHGRVVLAGHISTTSACARQKVHCFPVFSLAANGRPELLR